MARVDFYVLPDDQAQTRLMTVCRLIDKAQALGHRIHVHSDSRATAMALDDLLWTFRDLAFIPHAVEPGNADLPVSIGHGSPPPSGADVLINLATDIPDFYRDFERVVEVVNQEPGIRDAARVHFRFYREQGLELHHHTLD